MELHVLTLAVRSYVLLLSANVQMFASINDFISLHAYVTGHRTTQSFSPEVSPEFYTHEERLPVLRDKPH